MLSRFFAGEDAEQTLRAFRRGLHAAGGLVDVNETHGGPVDQVERIGGSVHRGGKAPQIDLTALF